MNLKETWIMFVGDGKALLQDFDGSLGYLSREEKRMSCTAVELCQVVYKSRI